MDRGILPRRLAVALGLRQLTPGARRPAASVSVPADTGGAWRPKYRMQDPAKDPDEPFGSESSDAGQGHAWANCTLASGGMALGWHEQSDGCWGGRLRHNQDDREGGTDLYDLRTAWSRYADATLTIKSGQGWDAVKAARQDWRAIVIQGTGNVPGSESYDGGHACVILPERQAGGADWLFGDPLASGWQWVDPDAIKTWAKAFSSGINFAVSRSHPPESSEPVPPPTPAPAPKPLPPPNTSLLASWALPVPWPSPERWGVSSWAGDGPWWAASGSWGPVYRWPGPLPVWGDASWLSAWGG